MASQTQGIQQLLAAEKRAAEKVAEARKRKFNWCHLKTCNNEVNKNKLFYGIGGFQGRHVV